MSIIEIVLAYINRVKQLAAKMKSISVIIDDTEMAMVVLVSHLDSKVSLLPFMHLVLERSFWI